MSKKKKKFLVFYLLFFFIKMELKRVAKYPLSKHVAVLLMSKKMDADFNEEDQGANSEISFFCLKTLKGLSCYSYS